MLHRDLLPDRRSGLFGTLLFSVILRFQAYESQAIDFWRRTGLRTSRSLLLGELPPVLPESASLPTHDCSWLYNNERRSPFFPDLHEHEPEETISIMELRPPLFPFQDCQLLPQRGILQCNLFVAGKDEHDKSHCAENPLEHEATLCLQR